MVRLINYINKWFRPPRVEGRESTDAYAEWEYRWGCELARLYMEPAGDLSGKKLLDIGCGLGGKTVALGEGGALAVFGTDISAEYASASVSYAGKSNRPFVWGFFTGDAARLPVTGGAFDTVVASDTMEHFEDPEGAFSEMVRVTRKGGAIWVFYTPYFSPLGSHLYDYIYIPWCHLLFSRRHLHGAIEHVVTSRHPGMSKQESSREAERIMRSFDRDLNRMSVRRFFRLVKRHPSVRLTYKQFKPAKFGVLKLFTYVPVLRELFTGSVICRLEKRE
ncbi:MAG: methyltransferase domain-containing protein [Candidatus Latescibacteria bacterium]|nr:methyltransferase domain-containing protein [Candidatus Latescibacterota bacterium]NIM66480.1 methyltransferase domain-containing protein [Candidatus Latescibacterota bacterium]NIO02960.1 methyltransferase domain-containing protein [Candidatus Latescibacterota bacterium]NIO30095.1 methyltransferase domain-containing protein [Candidatus Latescibacterota bacterium]NIO57714.1 methyltransferase domain-containing protein [Candidatus Latescibacterota bacterium]